MRLCFCLWAKNLPYFTEGGVKTVEGTLAGIASQMLFLWSLHHKG